MALYALFVVCLGALTLPSHDAPSAQAQSSDCRHMLAMELPPAFSVKEAPEIIAITPRVVPKATEPPEEDGTCSPPPIVEFIPVPQPPATYPRTGVGAFRPYPDCAAVGMPEAGLKMCGGVPSTSG
jgi:hypothetical protein